MKVTSSYGPDRTRATQTVSIVASIMLVTMLVSQLFGYEDFAVTLSTLSASSDYKFFAVLAASVVLLELMSLPYLLRMYLSPLMRIVSAAAGFFVAGFWIVSTLTNAHAENSGLLSTVITIPGGVMAALWTFILFGLICRVIYADSRFRHIGPLR